MMASTRLVGKVAGRLLGSLGARRPAFQAPCPATFLHKVQLPLLGAAQAVFCSTRSPPTEVSLKYKHGRLALEVPLTCRSETCLFFLQPMLMTVGDLVSELQKEDPGATAAVLSKDGERVAYNTLLEALLIDKHFKLVINNTVYNVHSPEKVCKSSEHALQLDDMKHVVHLLHTALNLPEHQYKQERQLLERLDRLKQELSPLEKMKAQLSHTADFQTSRAVWTGLALLSVQGGALAWLTWWVYSWDVMEPVTYFVTYATSMGAFAYYVLTKEDYVYPNAKDRQFLHYFYKGASKKKFNVEKYNELKDELAQVEDDLKRLRYPTQLQLPIGQIQPKE
ncbi:calcium uniporter regulatory subunit MCUb, mitochondrial-like isoform X4 [Corythoichthys intestinalis]|uniref:calcium uniporter regulatory subunit MCUb, mitochondrial-like isoform X4 n=1 Tax=Corythoichthys intestinalis TaxID=161448 RepID=UPI0025A5959A|nr:calcium uniporter regulatory subunit MCUb, mitochondrial-like isoform X4 [Corythoichthys intestinalis]